MSMPGGIQQPNVTPTHLSQLATLSADHTVYELVQVDRIQYPLYNTDGTWLYGFDTRQIYRTPAVGWSSALPTKGAALPGSDTPYEILTTGVADLIFASLQNAAGSHSLYRSTDGGATWGASSVLDIGQYNVTLGFGARTPLCRILSTRNFAERISSAGVRTFYLGEYNVSGTRTAGGDQDSVVLWKSVDLGLTWTKVTAWNVAGSHQLTHIHGVKVCPYTNLVYILCGDPSGQAAIIEWDGESAIPDSTLHASIAAGSVPGCRIVYGTQSSRWVDMVFYADRMVGLTDSPSAGPLDVAPASEADTTGFMVLIRSTFTLSKLADTISDISGRDGYYGIKTSTGEAVFCEASHVTPSSGQQYLRLHTTSRSLKRAGANGLMRVSTAAGAKYPGKMFVVGDNIFISLDTIYGTIANTNAKATIVVKIGTKPWHGVRPDNVSHGRWVDDVAGTDSVTGIQGQSPSAPWKTLKYALTNCGYGDRIIMPARHIQETSGNSVQINPSFSATSANTADPVCLSGDSRLTSSWRNADQATPGIVLNLAIAAMNFEVQDFWFRGQDHATPVLWNFNFGGAITITVQTIRASLGGMTTSSVRNLLMDLRAPTGCTINLTTHDTTFRTDVNSSGAIYLPVTASGTGTLNWVADRNCAFFIRNFEPVDQANVTLTFKDCCFIGHKAQLFTFNAGAARLPTLIRPRFHNNQAQAVLGGTHGLSAPLWSNAKSNVAFNPSAYFDGTCDVVTDKQLFTDPLNLDWSQPAY
jgi:hypothetical protein